MVQKRLAKETAQIKAFKKTARALGCDEDLTAFDAKLKKIAKAKTTTERIKKK